MDLLHIVRDTILTNQMIAAGDTVYAAVSGGADSVCLLHLLNRLASDEDFPCAFDLVCVHVHHRIRETTADEDADFVRDLCASWDIPFVLKKVNAKALAADHTHLSLEAAARTLRYEALAEAALTDGKKSVRIAMAHNQNDQAETVLLHLFRGSGMQGLTGIPAVRGSIFRPLLGVMRAEIETYLAERDIAYRTDETNAETTYLRNRIRHRLLPLIEQEINPQAMAHIVQTAGDIAGAKGYLDVCVWEAFRRCSVAITGDDRDTGKQAAYSFSVKALMRENKYLRSEVIRNALTYAGEAQAAGYDISRVHVDAVMGLCAGQNGRALLHLPRGVIVRRMHDTLTFYG